MNEQVQDEVREDLRRARIVLRVGGYVPTVEGMALLQDRTQVSALRQWLQVMAGKLRADELMGVCLLVSSLTYEERA